MLPDLDILVTNDDGYTSKGLRELVGVMRRFGRVTVVAPKTHQSGMSVALTLGGRTISYKKVKEEDGVSWAYVDGTPASCVKFALDQLFPGRRCDVVVSGINHGSNASVATNYSGTMGAAEEAAINGIPAIGVSLCEYGQDADFSSVTEYFPALFERLMEKWPDRKGLSYNINFPPSDVVIKGVRVCHEGAGYWIEELEPMMDGDTRLVNEDEESLFIMRGRFVDRSAPEDVRADHRQVSEGYITITPQTIDRTDREEEGRLSGLLDEDF